MRVLVTGAQGQLGQALTGVLAGEEVYALSHAELDITNPAEVGRVVNEKRPEWIFNTAAYNLVDAAEEEIEAAFRVNAFGVLHLARAAQEAGATLVHFSTDYVFDGRKGAPYQEEDDPHPLSLYAGTKLVGEWMARRYSEKCFVIRTCGLYGRGSKSKGGNFVDRMLAAARAGRTLRVVNDQVLTPTSARELAEKAIPLVRTGRCGLYHMTNEGQCSWFEFAGEVFRLAGLKPDLKAVSSAEYGAKARRPPYSVLDNAAYRALGLPAFRPWQEALAEYLQKKD